MGNFNSYIPVQYIYDLLDDYFEHEGRLTDKRFISGSQVKAEYIGHCT